MALVIDTWTGNLAPGSPLDGVEVEGYLTSLRTGINAIDDSQVIALANVQGSKLLDASIPDAKLLWTGVTGIKAPRLGAAQRKAIYGAKAFNLVAAATQTLAINFATDAVDTGGVFANATDLIITVGLVYTFVAKTLTAAINTITANGCNIVVRTSDNLNDTVAGSVHWRAFGRTA